MKTKFQVSFFALLALSVATDQALAGLPPGHIVQLKGGRICLSVFEVEAFDEYSQLIPLSKPAITTTYDDNNEYGAGKAIDGDATTFAKSYEKTYQNGVFVGDDEVWSAELPVGVWPTSVKVHNRKANGILYMAGAEVSVGGALIGHCTGEGVDEFAVQPQATGKEVRLEVPDGVTAVVYEVQVLDDDGPLQLECNFGTGKACDGNMQDANNYEAISGNTWTARVIDGSKTPKSVKVFFKNYAVFTKIYFDNEELGFLDFGQKIAHLPIDKMGMPSSVPRGHYFICQGYYKSTNSIEKMVRWDPVGEDYSQCEADFCYCDYKVPDDLNFKYLTGNLQNCNSGDVRVTHDFVSFEDVEATTGSCPVQSALSACFCRRNTPKVVLIPVVEYDGLSTNEDMPVLHKAALQRAAAVWIRMIKNVPEREGDSDISEEWLKTTSGCMESRVGSYELPQYVLGGNLLHQDMTYVFYRMKLDVLAMASEFGCLNLMAKPFIQGEPNPTWSSFNVVQYEGNQLQLDYYNLGTMQGFMRTYSTAKHEIGHALGLTVGLNHYRQFDTAACKYYITGTQTLLGLQELKDSFGAYINPTPAFIDTEKVYIETDCDPDTCSEATCDYNGHWDTSTFQNELMADDGNNSLRPISALSLYALRDAGYDMKVGIAEAYNAENAGFAQSYTNTAFNLEIGEVCGHNGNCADPLVCSNNVCAYRLSVF
jgi:hypothetical protein